MRKKAFFMIVHKIGRKMRYLMVKMHNLVKKALKTPIRVDRILFI